MAKKVNNILIGNNAKIDNSKYFTLHLKDDVNGVDETMDIRTLLTLVKHMMKKMDIPMDYMNMGYEDIITILHREENMDEILDENK